MHPTVSTSPRSRAVSAWLWSLAAIVFLMVVLGGATRLTESGLSITEWKPVTGVIPPLTHAAWLEAFDKYKRIPQYLVMFPDMTLGHFQAIFLMEWTHRLVGRLLGIVLVVPLLVFLVARQLNRRLLLQMLGVFALGGLQGFVGWWMVSSGLTGRVEVAQERLAIHLLLASLTFAALTWIATAQRAATEPAVPPALRRLAGLIVVLVLVQIGLGALVAGLRAGYAYNTWPLMAGQLVPGQRARHAGAVVAQSRRQRRRSAVPAPDDRLSRAGAVARAGRLDGARGARHLSRPARARQTPASSRCRRRSAS